MILDCKRVVTASVFMAQVFHSSFILTGMIFSSVLIYAITWAKASYMMFLRIQNRTQMANLNLAQKMCCKLSTQIHLTAADAAVKLVLEDFSPLQSSCQK